MEESPLSSRPSSSRVSELEEELRVERTRSSGAMKRLWDVEAMMEQQKLGEEERLREARKEGYREGAKLNFLWEGAKLN